MPFILFSKLCYKDYSQNGLKLNISQYIDISSILNLSGSKRLIKKSGIAAQPLRELNSKKLIKKFSDQKSPKNSKKKSNNALQKYIQTYTADLKLLYTIYTKAITEQCNILRHLNSSSHTS